MRKLHNLLLVLCFVCFLICLILGGIDFFTHIDELRTPLKKFTDNIWTVCAAAAAVMFYFLAILTEDDDGPKSGKMNYYDFREHGYNGKYNEKI